MYERFPGSITDVAGITVGHAQDEAARTGVTALFCGADAVGGVAGVMEYAKTDLGLPALNSKQIWTLISLIFMTSFGTWGLPHMIQKFFGIKSDAQAKRGIWISSVFSLVAAGGGYFVGSLCHLFFNRAAYDGLAEQYGKTFLDYLVPTMLKLANIPSVLTGIVVVLLLAGLSQLHCEIACRALCSEKSNEEYGASAQKRKITKNGKGVHLSFGT